MANTENEQYQELRSALKNCKQYFIYAGIFSAAVNILMLTPILYMLNVYDQVIPSASLSTLSMLSLLMVCLLLALGGFEWVRNRILISASNRLDTNLRKRVSDATFKRSLISGGMISNPQPMNDLNSIRQFLTGNGLFAFFDAPWFPIYVGVMFMFHPWFGIMGITSGLILITLAFMQEWATANLLKDANGASAKITAQFHSSLRNAEVVAAMGMAEDIRRKHEAGQNKILDLQTRASQKAGNLTAITRSLRMILQSCTLGLGAYLALNQEISPGMMIAGSLLLGRALAPIDSLVAGWKGFSITRAKYEKLGDLLDKVPLDKDTMSLPAPSGALTLEQVTVTPPGSQTIVVKGVNLEVSPGTALGVVGPSASGKSTLARAILGIWPTYAGKVRLDGADISSWDRTELGPFIGYLPQDIELFDGTIADNICRFREPDSEKIVAAAKLAGVHEMILHLPEGYDTVIGGAGGMLSGGQRQRIGLARSVYDQPKLLVLDEPNSNLDDQGEKELVEAIRRIKAQGCTIIVITHRTMVLQCVDNILVMKDGAAVSYGPKEQVLNSLMGPAAVPKSAAN